MLTFFMRSLTSQSYSHQICFYLGQQLVLNLLSIVETPSRQCMYFNLFVIFLSSILKLERFFCNDGKVKQFHFDGTLSRALGDLAITKVTVGMREEFLCPNQYNQHVSGVDFSECEKVNRK